MQNGSGATMKCNKCQYRKWEEGDREYSPPGYGVYYCELMAEGALPEAVAKGEAEPEKCPMKVMEAEIAASEEAYSKPPCQECGAVTQAEAETKCHCAGDKDDCHGTKLWPD